MSLLRCAYTTTLSLECCNCLVLSRGRGFKLLYAFALMSWSERRAELLPLARDPRPSLSQETSHYHALIE